MTEQNVENKVRQEATKIKKDLINLERDGAARLGRFKVNVKSVAGKAKEDLTTTVEDRVIHLSEGIEKITGDAKDTLSRTAGIVKKDLRHGLSQYNARAQEVADTIPGGFGAKVTRYPWVAITVAMTSGFLLGGMLGSLLKSARRPVGQLEN